ncbi:hypothetical protein HUA74_39790 [Myxococcus sp. CA051A]|uniref:hypothetical protein n=1 Tax=unclassified Myxococcus TaxID=2648731 RepID=UPI00157A89E5|nr:MULTISPECIES: hypothetical protein [unclassified Myxococcus]NTX17393.1 hypothetical protein [Myxococcus sp. CA056]NTX66810.1 hypothetical protein [Myxococcus sp. CA051A]
MRPRRKRCAPPDSRRTRHRTRSGTAWEQQAYVKASNTGVNDNFGLRLALSADGYLLGVGVPYEDSKAKGINGNQADNSSEDSGAVYLFKL